MLFRLRCKDIEIDGFTFLKTVIRGGYSIGFKGGGGGKVHPKFLLFIKKQAKSLTIVGYTLEAVKRKQFIL